MPYLDGYNLYVRALEEEDKQQAFQLYLVNYARMTKEDYLTFDDWYNAGVEAAKVQQEMKTKSKEDILDEVYEMRKKVGEK